MLRMLTIAHVEGDDNHNKLHDHRAGRVREMKEHSSYSPGVIVHDDQEEESRERGDSSVRITKHAWVLCNDSSERRCRLLHWYWSTATDQLTALCTRRPQLSSNTLESPSNSWNTVNLSGFLDVKHFELKAGAVLYLWNHYHSFMGLFECREVSRINWKR